MRNYCEKISLMVFWTDYFAIILAVTMLKLEYMLV